MEQRPEKNRLSENEQLVSDLYDCADWLFTKRRISSVYEKFNSRYCKLDLTKDELEHIGPTLFAYAVDPPYALDITLMGHNPYIYEDQLSAFVWITTNHHDVAGNEIVSNYTLLLDRREKVPVSAYKDVRRKISEHDEVNDLGQETLPLELEYMYHNRTPLSREELRAFHSMLQSL